MGQVGTSQKHSPGSDPLPHSSQGVTGQAQEGRNEAHNKNQSL